MILKEEPFSPLETFYAYYLVPSNQFCCLYWTYAQNKKTLAAVHCFYLSYTHRHFTIRAMKSHLYIICRICLLHVLVTNVAVGSYAIPSCSPVLVYLGGHRLPVYFS